MNPKTLLTISLIVMISMILDSLILYFGYGIIVPDLVPWLDHQTQFANLDRGAYYTWLRLILEDIVYVTPLVIGVSLLYKERIPLWLAFGVWTIDVMGENMINLLSINAQDLVVGHNWILSTITTIKWIGVAYGVYLIFIKKYPKL